jgi:hypothetical protein
LAIFSSHYKTSEELSEFIKKAKSGNFMLDLVKQPNEREGQDND